MRKSIFILACLATLLVAGPGFAQGTNQQFPDPLDHDALLKLLAPLGLTPGQATAIDQAHDAYLESFRVLRQRRIKPFMDDGAEWSHDAANRGETEKRLELRNSIERGIARLDEQLFATLATSLTVSQQARLPQLATRRERRRLQVDPSHTSWRMPPLASLDLTTYIAAEDAFDDVVLDAIAEPLLAYEMQLTQAFRRVHSMRRDSVIEQAEVRDARRAQLEDRMSELTNQFDLSTEAGRTALQDSMMDLDLMSFALAETESINSSREELVRISRMNRQFLDTLFEHVDQEVVARIKRKYTRRAYAMLHIPRDIVSNRIRVKIKALEAVEDESALAGELDTLRDGFLTRRAGLVDRLVIAGERGDFRNTRGHVVIETPDGRRTEREDELQPIRDELEQLNRSTLEQYAALTGEEIPPDDRRITFTDEDGNASVIIQGTEALAAPVMISSGGDGDTFAAISTVTIEMTEDVALDTSVGLPVAGDFTFEVTEGDGGQVYVMQTHSSHWLPGPLSREAVDALAGDLDIGDQRVILDDLYADYVADYRELRETVLGPAEKAVRSLGRPSEDAPDVDEAFGGVRRAMTQVTTLDDAYFDNVAVMFDKPQVAARHEFARRRAAHQRGATAPAWMMGGDRARVDEVDVRRVASSLSLNDADRNLVGEALEGYDETAAECTVRAWSDQLAKAERDAEAAANARAAGGQGMWFSTFASPPDRDSDAARALQERGELNAAIVDRLETTLSPTGWATFLHEYKRKAYPSVYRDQDTVHGLYAKALDMPLGERHDTLVQFVAEYRTEYERICDRMIERVRSNTGDFDPADIERWRKMEELNRDLTADRFERSNLNQKSRRRLFDLLVDEERASLGLSAP